MRFTDKQLETILENAPTGATHIDKTHNLYDLGEILELRQEIERLQLEITDLKIERDSAIQGRYHYVECNNCEWVGDVAQGQEDCPSCCTYGHLEWATRGVEDDE